MSTEQLKQPKRHLPMAQQLAFMQYLKGHYTSSKLDDSQFADLASKTLGFEIRPHQVGSYRQGLGLPINFPHGNRTKEGSLRDLQKRLEKAEDTIELLQKQVGALQQASKFAIPFNPNQRLGG